MGFINGIIRYKRSLDDLSKTINCGRFHLYCDCIKSRIIYGCALNHYIVGGFYKRSSLERRQIFTYRCWEKVVHSANDVNYIHFLKEKVDFNTYFHDYIGRKWLYAKDMTLGQFRIFCKEFGGAIVKPMDGLEGEGVHYESFVFRDEEELQQKYDSLYSKNLLIEERIVQHPDMVFGNKSVNTVRVYTVLNRDTNKVSIVKTVVRAGIGDSIVDNSHSGGCAYEVDTERGYVVSPYYAANGKSSYIHPGTDICMLGRKIPYWNEVIELCSKAACHLPECRYIGWDVAITEKGPLLIEGNHMPDLDMIEFVGSYGYKYQIMRGLGL